MLVLRGATQVKVVVAGATGPATGPATYLPAAGELDDIYTTQVVRLLPLTIIGAIGNRCVRR